MRIVILEDDTGPATMIHKAVAELGHEGFIFGDGRALLRELHRDSYDLYVVDWGVPHVQGPDIVRWIRRNVDERVPVLFVTNRDEEADVVEGLTCGADDYMIKPLRVQELKARIVALMRRAYPSAVLQATTEFGPYRFDLHRREVSLHGIPVPLKPKEYQLALFLFRNTGRLLSKDYLMAELWGSGDIDSRTVVTHVSQLRRKLDIHPGNGFRLTPVYSLGYRLEQVDARHE
ncbi:response regulator transcription factor [Pigmentiphaga soli]|uniref:Response regulator transcription factor n=1 Tax=Pigmentiphaga soli TaxID=1007095 RepID=A0ABP8H7F0_9BURK